MYLKATELFVVILAFVFLAACTKEKDSPKTPDKPLYGIEFVSNSEEILSVLGEGGVEISLMTFKVTQTNGQGAPGVLVNFQLGVGLQSATLSEGNSIVSDADGFASTFLQSGHIAEVGSVIAIVDGHEQGVRSDEIIISTQRLSASTFTIGAIITDQNTLIEDGIRVAEGAKPGAIVEFKMNLTQTVTDSILDGAHISFVSPETGAFTLDSCVVNRGECKVSWMSNEDKDVGFRASVLAYGHGSESFEDANSNYLYDKGERFVDLGEPFVDENENGLFDDEEFFLDNNGDGEYTSQGNGFWDGPCIMGGCEGASSTVIWDTLDLQLDH